MLGLRNFLQLFTMDPSLGRVDISSLPDQTLMELLFQHMNFDEKADLKEDDGSWKDVCEWDRIAACTDDRVTSITMYEGDFGEEQFQFHLIPPLVSSLIMMSCNLHGTLDASTLPSDFRHLSLHVNKLGGSLDLKAFPHEMNYIEISDNAFCGSCVPSDLPDSLKYFYASNNHFSGEIALNDLPPAMTALALDNNQLSGQITIESLPPAMCDIDLSFNNFSGDLTLLALPDSLEFVTVSNNALSGTAIIAHAPSPMPIVMDVGDSIKVVIDEAGSHHPWEESIIHRAS